MRKAFTAASALCALLALALLAQGAQTPPVVSISNEFIKITVNAGEAENGRFGVDTTGGDPENPNDDNMPLIYGRPAPWTSYTTIRINGTDWVFGGKASKRAGLAGRYGEMLMAPTQKGSSIITSYMLGTVKAVQDLSFVRSAMTGYTDTARIAYTLTNMSDREAKVGLRLLIDTMLGANDGAPLRAAETSVLTDTRFDGAVLPDFWQAFDTLAEPVITSQATLRGGELTLPSKVVFSNWGSFADSLWDVRLVTGRDFTREGEFDLDSAAAMYWDDMTLKPGEQMTLVTYYGLGGIVLSPGTISIGLASPGEVAAANEGQASSFQVVAYIQNTGKGPALDVKAELVLPKGLRVASQTPSARNVGDLKQGSMTQLAWQVISDGATYGEQLVTVKVNASNAEPNSVARNIRLLSPPRLSLKLDPLELSLDDMMALKPSYPVRARVTNIGDSQAYWVAASLELSGARLLAGDARVKPIGHLAAGEEYVIFWHMAPQSSGIAVQAKVKAEASNARQVQALATGEAPKSVKGIRLTLEPSGDGFMLARIMAMRLSGVARVVFDLAWDGKALEPLGRKPVNPGTLMLMPDGSSPGFSQGFRESGAIRGITCSFLPGGEPDGELMTVDFNIAGPGGITMSLENVRAYDAAGRLLSVTNDGLEAIIRQ